MIYNNKIFEKYFESISENFIRSLLDITEIVVHGTGGGQSAPAILKWMENGERSVQYRKGVALFHYEIDRNGDIYQVIPPSYWVYHSSCGKHDKCTVGIELVNPKVENLGGYTDKQYESLIEFFKDHISDYFVNVKSIVSHGYNKQKYSGKYKNCPGQEFDWDRLARALNLNKIQHECYEV